MNKLIIVSIMLLLFSCERATEPPAFVNSDLITRNLIQLCVDSTLRLDSGINSMKYFVDFKPTALNRKGIKQFLEARSEAAEINLDSLLNVKRKVSKYRFLLPGAVIRFEKITVRNGGLLLIEMPKTRSAEGFIEAELLLKQEGEKFTCISSEITRIG